MIDELLTPDSSRYWPLKEYVPGKAQSPSFDKQYVRDWLVKKLVFGKVWKAVLFGKERQEWFVIDEEVVKGTREQNAEAVDLPTRK